jgi:hypothetical protein
MQVHQPQEQTRRALTFAVVHVSTKRPVDISVCSEQTRQSRGAEVSNNAAPPGWANAPRSANQAAKQAGICRQATGQQGNAMLTRISTARFAASVTRSA